jgi:hypothetical protein
MYQTGSFQSNQRKKKIKLADFTGGSAGQQRRKTNHLKITRRAAAPSSGDERATDHGGKFLDPPVDTWQPVKGSKK